MSLIPASVIPDALGLAEDVVLAALRPLGSAWWSGRMPAGTAGRLLALLSDPAYLPQYWIAQHQDGGGSLAPVVGSAGWSGEIVITCYSGDDGRARTGLALAHAALSALSAPAGYGRQLRYLGPIDRPNPDPDGLYGRANAYQLTLRRI